MGARENVSSAIEGTEKEKLVEKLGFGPGNRIGFRYMIRPRLVMVTAESVMWTSPWRAISDCEERLFGERVKEEEDGGGCEVEEMKREKRAAKARYGGGIGEGLVGLEEIGLR